MREDDTRRCNAIEQHERRKQIIRFHRQGYGVMKVAELAGVTWPTARKAIDLYEKGGMKALTPRPRGAVPGVGRALGPDQEKTVREAIRDRRPEQLKLDFALWNRRAVRELIEQEFGIRISLSCISKYMKRWGYTPQKPIRRAYEQNPEAVRKWLDEEYPAIKEKCGRQKGEIHWCDETGIVNTDAHGRSFAPRGRTPVISTPTVRRKLSMISSVTNRGNMRWMMIKGAFNAERLIEFFMALVHDADRKVLAIVDNLPPHHCRPVKEWLEKNSAHIEVFYLPSYSPELNPDERLNADLKNALREKAPVRTEKKLRESAESHVRIIENDPNRVRAYFNDRYVAYAK